MVDINNDFFLLNLFQLEEFCEFPCQCPIMELKCNEGVKVIRDGCDCCYMCARQHGDRCSPKERCADGLYCHLGDDNRGVGICKGKRTFQIIFPSLALAFLAFDFFRFKEKREKNTTVNQKKKIDSLPNI